MQTLVTLDTPPIPYSLVRRLFSVRRTSRRVASGRAIPLSGLRPRPGEDGRSPSMRPFAPAILMALAIAIIAVAPPSSAAGFAAAAPMHIGRMNHTASLLPNGNVLVAGGYGFYGYGPLTSAEIYDPVTNSWRHVTSMYGPRYRHAATTLQDSSIVVTGGAQGPSAIASAERFDPVTETWIRLPLMSQERADHTATLLPSGKVLVAGGTNPTVLRTAEIFDPVSQSWTTASPMGSLRYLHTATLLVDGRVLVAGGLGGPDNPAGSAEIYDPASNTWSPTGSLNCSRFRHTALLLPSGKVMVIDGNYGGSATSCNEAYDPSTGTWTRLAPNAIGRSDAATSLLVSGKVLLSGGSGSTPFTKVAEVYDPASDRWTTTGNLLVARYAHTSTLLASGGVLVAGGTNGNVLDSTERYTPPTPTFLDLEIPASSVVGQPYLVAVGVTADQGTPTGSVSISDDSGATCGPVVVSGGAASCSLASATAGIRSVTATFQPADTGFDASIGQMSHVVEPALTVLGLTVEPEASVDGEPVDARVSIAVAAPGAGMPHGLVHVAQVGANNSCTIELPELECTLSIGGEVGLYTVEAVYDGDDNFSGSSASIDHRVYDPFTALQIAAVTPEPSVVGQPVAVAYGLNAADGDPTGFVTVTANTGQTCTASVAAGFCDLTFFVDGPRSLVAHYSGDAFHDPSDSLPATHDVQDATTTLTVTGHAPDPSVPFQAVLVEATLQVDSPGAGTPHGGVRVSDGADDCVIPEGGSSCEIVLQTRGPRTLTAEYSGDGNYTASVDLVVHHVNRLPVVIDHDHSAPRNGTLTVAAGMGVLVGTSDADGDGLLVVNAGKFAAAGIGGVVDLAATGAFTYVPPANATGLAQFGFTVSDGLEQVGGLVSIHVLEPLDLSIQIDDGVGFAAGGSAVQYLIDVYNAGPADAVGAVVRTSLPDNLIGATWLCVAREPGASCTSSGSGNIEDTVFLPSGATLSYWLNGTVAFDPEMPLASSASVLAPQGRLDTDGSNDSASDVDVVGIFADSFD